MLRFFFLTVVFAASTVASSAQIQSGTITGVISDQTGAFIANAVVKLEHATAGGRHQVISGSAGEFTFNNVPFDQYTLRVIAAGFETTTQPIAVHSNLP